MPKKLRKLEGLPIVDAKRSLRVHISPADVSKGRTKNPASCAAAKACLRETACTKVRVHLSRTFLMMGDRWDRYVTPPSVRTEIVSFDRGANFHAGEFTFRAPKGAERLGYKPSGTNTGRNNPRHQKKKRIYHTVSGVRPFFNAKHG